MSLFLSSTPPSFTYEGKIEKRKGKGEIPESKLSSLLPVQSCNISKLSLKMTTYLQFIK